jgi:hypothetical protein
MAIGLVRVVGAAPIARQPADRGDGAAAPIIPVSMSGQIDHTVEVILRRERSGRPLCANSGHCRAPGERVKSTQGEPNSDASSVVDAVTRHRVAERAHRTQRGIVPTAPHRVPRRHSSGRRHRGSDGDLTGDVVSINVG